MKAPSPPARRRRGSITIRSAAAAAAEAAAELLSPPPVSPAGGPNHHPFWLRLGLPSPPAAAGLGGPVVGGWVMWIGGAGWLRRGSLCGDRTCGAIQNQSPSSCRSRRRREHPPPPQRVFGAAGGQGGLRRAFEMGPACLIRLESTAAALPPNQTALRAGLPLSIEAHDGQEEDKQRARILLSGRRGRTTLIYSSWLLVGGAKPLQFG